MSTAGLGIDVGGSGIKGGPVDLAGGELLAERRKYATPRPASPAAVAEAVSRLAGDFASAAPEGPVGVTLPAVVQRGVARTAANIDPSWIGTDARALLSEALGRSVVVVNDADAAAVAEHRFGAARDAPGTVLVTTLGTGIGSALLVDGRLVPNTEFGHLEINGADAEKWAAASAKDREDLDYREWAARLQRYYTVLYDLVWPDLIVVGGGVSRDAKEFLPLLDLGCPVVAAKLRNTAGIVGAAALAGEGHTG